MGRWFNNLIFISTFSNNFFLRIFVLFVVWESGHYITSQLKVWIMEKVFFLIELLQVYAWRLCKRNCQYLKKKLLLTHRPSSFKNFKSFLGVAGSQIGENNNFFFTHVFLYCSVTKCLVNNVFNFRRITTNKFLRFRRRRRIYILVTLTRKKKSEFFFMLLWTAPLIIMSRKFN